MAGISARVETRPAELRPARAEDAAGLATLMVAAGGGYYEFLIGPGTTAAEAARRLAPAIASGAGVYSWRRCLVAERNGRLAAMINLFPIDLARGLPPARLPPERLAHLAPLDVVQDWGSLFVSALAVAAEVRRSGLGSALLAAACGQARAAGLPRLSLHVWGDNAPALALYRREGFRHLRTAEIPWHPDLPRRGGSLLLSRPV